MPLFRSYVATKGFTDFWSRAQTRRQADVEGRNVPAMDYPETFTAGQGWAEARTIGPVSWNKLLFNVTLLETHEWGFIIIAAKGKLSELKDQLVIKARLAGRQAPSRAANAPAVPRAFRGSLGKKCGGRRRRCTAFRPVQLGLSPRFALSDLSGSDGLKSRVSLTPHPARWVPRGGNRYPGPPCRLAVKSQGGGGCQDPGIYPIAFGENKRVVLRKTILIFNLATPSAASWAMKLCGTPKDEVYKMLYLLYKMCTKSEHVAHPICVRWTEMGTVSKEGAASEIRCAQPLRALWLAAGASPQSDSCV